MPGIGPRPKDPSKRARTNADPIPTTVLRPFEPCRQPPLPKGTWPKQTRDWWKVWGESAQAEMFTATDWAFLLDTAVLHAKLWSGETSSAPELRLRVAKFGATIEDRARLRIQFAAADEADAKRPVAASVEDRYGD